MPSCIGHVFIYQWFIGSVILPCALCIDGQVACLGKVPLGNYRKVWEFKGLIDSTKYLHFDPRHGSSCHRQLCGWCLYESVIMTVLVKLFHSSNVSLMSVQMQKSLHLPIFQEGVVGVLWFSVVSRLMSRLWCSSRNMNQEKDESCPCSVIILYCILSQREREWERGQEWERARKFV